VQLPYFEGKHFVEGLPNVTVRTNTPLIGGLYPVPQTTPLIGGPDFWPELEGARADFEVDDEVSESAHAVVDVLVKAGREDTIFRERLATITEQDRTILDRLMKDTDANEGS
jgi:hypothetical protein